MKKNFAKIISVLLVLSMFGTCVYATELPSTPVEEPTNAEEQLPETPGEGEGTEEPEVIKEYVKEFKITESKVNEENLVSLTFGWLIEEDSDLSGIDVELYEELAAGETEVEALAVEELEADATEVSFKELEKGKPYYAVLKAYTENEGEKVYVKTLKSMGIYLDKPVINNTVASGTIVNIEVEPVAGANKYIVSYETGGVEAEASFAEPAIKLAGLDQYAQYNFKVKAVFEAKDPTDETVYSYASDWSDPSSAVTGETVLPKPVLDIDAYNLGAILHWEKVDEATSYEIWRCYSNKWTNIANVDADTLTFKNTGLKLNKKYYYKIKAVREVNGNIIESELSNQVQVTAKKYLTNSTFRMGYNTGTVKRNSAKYEKDSATKTINKTKLKKGTKVTILSRKAVGKHSMANVKTSSGATYWIKSCNISYNAPYTTKDYTKDVKENWVNSRGYSSSTKYLLVISHYTQKVYLYTGSKGNWKLNKTYKCVTGKSSTRTPQGQFKLYKKAARGSCYKYVSYFRNKNSFHTRPYGTKTMGRPASNGCIRLYDNDAKFIYKSIPKNTTVVSF